MTVILNNNLKPKSIVWEGEVEGEVIKITYKEALDFASLFTKKYKEEWLWSSSLDL